MKLYLWSYNPIRNSQGSTGHHLQIHSSFWSHINKTETVASYKKPRRWFLKIKSTLMPCRQQPTEWLSSQVLRQHWPCLEKTPEGEVKPAKAEQPWTWWQDGAETRSADKHIYSFTQQTELPHLLNFSSHSLNSSSHSCAPRAWAVMTFWAPSIPQAVRSIMIRFKQMISTMLDNFFFFVTWSLQLQRYFVIMQNFLCAWIYPAGCNDTPGLW